MFVIVARDSARARAMPRRSPLTSVTPALSIATSVPVPIAMPTSALRQRRRVVDAVARHRDDAPCGLQPLHLAAFCVGQHLGDHLVDGRASRATAARGGPAVAGDHDDAHAVARAARAAPSRVVRLDRIGDAEQPSERARRRRRTSPSDPRARSSLGARPPARRRRRRPSSVISASLPSATLRPSTVPLTPLPVTTAKSRRRRRARCRARARPRRWRRPADARCPARALAARRSSSASVTPGAATDRHEARLAFGQRAGLVDDQRVDVAQALDRLRVAEQHAQPPPPCRSRP